MSNLHITPVEHNLGGSNTPYEKYHLTLDQLSAATRNASMDEIGLVKAGLSNCINYITNPPETVTSYGLKGMRAIDADYMYICVDKDTWRRMPLTKI